MPEQSRSDQGKFMQVANEPLAKHIRGVRFPLSIDNVIERLPNKSDFIRTAVIDKLKAEGLLGSQQ